MNEPLVSVIVASHRRNISLRTALESLAKQSYPNIEVVLVDDNAHAQWNRTVAELAGEARSWFHHGLILVVNGENLGSAQARNVGVQRASGAYITFLDDDDVYLPDKIKQQLTAMLKNVADFSITDLKLYNGRDVLIEHRVRSYITQTDPDSLLRAHLLYHMTGTDTLMFRAEYLRAIGGFPPIDVGDEFYLMMKAICGGGRFCYVPGCEVKAYIHTGEDGLSSGEGKIRGENALYQYKQSFFDRLTPREFRYVRMRHYAVLAFAQLRRKRYGACLLNGICGFCAAPAACIRLLLKGS